MNHQRKTDRRIHNSNDAPHVPHVASSVCCVSLLYELGLLSGFEIHTSHYCVALSRCAASCVTLLHPQAALKQCQSKIRKEYSCTLNNTEPHTCYNFKRTHMFCTEWVRKRVCDTALLNPTKIRLSILQLKACFPKNKSTRSDIFETGGVSTQI